MVEATKSTVKTLQSVSGRGVQRTARFACLAILALLCAAPSVAASAETPNSYLLGIDDQITVRLLGADEVPDKPFRIDERGNVDLPLVGSVHAAGLSVHDLAAVLEVKFGVYVKNPQASVFLQEMRSQPVSVLGAVTSPGVHQLQGHKTLLEMLAIAGGVRLDAGYRVRVSRRAQWGLIPVPGAKTDPEGQVSVAEIGLKGLLEAGHPADNIAIMPDDVITVPVAELVYVMGEVKKPGGFVLGERREVTVLQALAMADGATSSAKRAQARILRTSASAPSASVTQIPVDIKRIIEGHAPDVPMEARDILFVPGDGAKRITQRVIDSIFSVGTAMAVYRP